GATLSAPFRALAATGPDVLECVTAAAQRRTRTAHRRRGTLPFLPPLRLLGRRCSHHHGAVRLVLHHGHRAAGRSGAAAAAAGAGSGPADPGMGASYGGRRAAGWADRLSLLDVLPSASHPYPRLDSAAAVD